MLPDRVSNPGPLTYKSGALPIALRGPAFTCINNYVDVHVNVLKVRHHKKGDVKKKFHLLYSNNQIRMSRRYDLLSACGGSNS